MSPEEIETLLAENAALRAEVGALRLQLAAAVQQLQIAVVRIASPVSCLRTTLRLPFRLIQSYLATLHNFS